MKRLNIITITVITMALFSSCVYNYKPEVVSQQENILVVEGDILAEQYSSFSASFSTSLDEKFGAVEAYPARVYVESETGSNIYEGVSQNTPDVKYKNSKKLTFVCDTRAIDTSIRHRVVIILQNQTKYYSEWLTFLPKTTIDEVYYQLDTTVSATICVNSHSTIDSLKYFKWSYLEDWEIKSHYSSTLIYDSQGDSLIVMDNYYLQNRYFCWKQHFSTEILVNQTQSLSENVFIGQPIKTIYKDDNRLQHLYAIEVSQIAITKEAYTYWNTMMKNNDGTSGIFAPMPSEMRGNIYCEQNPDEMVLGYVSASQVAKKRIFITRQETMLYSSKPCGEQEPFNTPSEWKTAKLRGYDVVYSDLQTGEIFWAPKECVDCRMLGSKSKPIFWPTPEC